MTEPQPTLPGLDLPAGEMAHIVTDVEATITALTEAGRVKPEHSALLGMVRLTARKLAAVGQYGQAYGVAMLLRELREGLAALPADAAGEDDADEFAQLVDAVRSAELRNTPQPVTTD